MNIREINLEECMPTCDEAMDYLKSSLKLAKQNKYKCLLIIHGYGSTGKGGAIRTKARQWLNAQVKKGIVKLVRKSNFGLCRSLLYTFIRLISL